MTLGRSERDAALLPSAARPPSANSYNDVLARARGEEPLPVGMPGETEPVCSIGARLTICRDFVSNTLSAGFSQPLVEIARKRPSGEGTSSSAGRPRRRGGRQAQSASRLEEASRRCAEAGEARWPRGLLRQRRERRGHAQRERRDPRGTTHRRTEWTLEDLIAREYFDRRRSVERVAEVAATSCSASRQACLAAAVPV